MKKFNINDYIYIQITNEGWEHLLKTVGRGYIQSCIKQYKVEIDNEIWYKLQAHSVFELLPINFGGKLTYNTNIMFDDKDLK